MLILVLPSLEFWDCICYWPSQTEWTPSWALPWLHASHTNWRRPDSEKQSRNFIHWSRDGEGRACAPKTPSPRRRKVGGGAVLKGKRQVHPQKLGKRAEISRHSHAWTVPQAPSNAALIVFSKIQVPLWAEVLAWWWKKASFGLFSVSSAQVLLLQLGWNQFRAASRCKW